VPQELCVEMVWIMCAKVASVYCTHHLMSLHYCLKWCVTGVSFVCNMRYCNASWFTKWPVD